MRSRGETARAEWVTSGETRLALLTGMVHIAVFAAFRLVSAVASPSIPEFKPVCAIWRLDVSCYGWQKRQDAATSGKVGGKNGTVWRGDGRFHAHSPPPGGGLARGRGGRVCRWMRLFKVRAAPGADVFLELIYHNTTEMSRR